MPTLDSVTKFSVLLDENVFYYIICTGYDKFSN